MTDPTKIDANMLLQEWTAAGVDPKAQAERFGNMVSAAEPWVLVLAQQARGKPVIEKVVYVKRIAKLLRRMPEDDRKIFLRLAAEEMSVEVEMFESLLEEDEPVAVSEPAILAVPENKIDDSRFKEGRFKLFSMADAMAPQPPIDWIVDGVFSAGSVSLVVGEPGCKKTWSMLDMAICVARGDSWLGHTTLPRSVLLIDEESGKRRISERLAKVNRGHGGNIDTLVHYNSLARYDISNPEDVKILNDLIAYSMAGLVVIDALVDVMMGRDENSVKDVQPIFTNFRTLAEETMTALVIIHHSNRAGSYRGSSAISGAVDTMIEVESKSDSGDVNFKSTKTRDVPAFKFSGFAHFGEEQFHMTESEKSSIEALSHAQDLVITYLDITPGASLKDVETNAAHNALAPTTIRGACRSLVEPGFVKAIGAAQDSDKKGGKGKEAQWYLTEKGQIYADKIR